MAVIMTDKIGKLYIGDGLHTDFDGKDVLLTHCSGSDIRINLKTAIKLKSYIKEIERANFIGLDKK